MNRVMPVNGADSDIMQFSAIKFPNQGKYPEIWPKPGIAVNVMENVYRR